MAEFTPINTQAELDKIISDRLAREREAAAKRYEGWKSPEDVAKEKKALEDQLGAVTTELTGLREKQQNHEKELAEKDAVIKGHETRSVKLRIAHETGIPYELADRLSGETEADIRKDAEAVKGILGGTHTAEPLATQEVKGKASNSDAAFKELAAAL